MAKVLIVEDDTVIADGMARHLGAAGFDPGDAERARPHQAHRLDGWHTIKRRNRGSREPYDHTQQQPEDSRKAEGNPDVEGVQLLTLDDGGADADLGDNL